MMMTKMVVLSGDPREIPKCHNTNLCESTGAPKSKSDDWIFLTFQCVYTSNTSNLTFEFLNC